MAPESLSKPLIVADIFCGAGGLSAGFAAARPAWDKNHGERYEIVYGIDIDKDAIDSFRAYHFPEADFEKLDRVAPCRDVKNITAKNILKAIHPHRHVDVLIGGPNCQGVSAAGLRNPNDDRNNMLLAFIKLVKELRPAWFVLENVPGLTHTNNRELLAEIFTQFNSIEGYKVAGDVLLAADYGVAQLRYRLFIIGTNAEAPIRFPPATHVPSELEGTGKYSGVSFPCYRTVQDEITDLKDFPPRVYDIDDLPNCQNHIASHIPRNHYCIKVSETNRSRIHTIAEGQDWRDMPIRLLPERFFATRASDQKGAYGRLLWDWPAYTVTNTAYNVTAGPFTHPSEDRPISVREAARLQSFDDKHVFYGSVVSQYRQVGNAVPSGLAKAVAEAILYCHYKGNVVETTNWGKSGRLTLRCIQASLDNNEIFPTMTPRKAHPLYDRRQKKRTPSQTRRKDNIQTQESIWDSTSRVININQEDHLVLRKIAEQPGNYRAAKRAKAIVQFIDGVEKEIIVEESNVSEASVKKWIDGYFQHGLEGWRAYHTPVERIVGEDKELAGRLETAVSLVRRIDIAPMASNLTQVQPKRLYMNQYLLSLIEQFGNKSIAELIEDVDSVLYNRVGTVYVGDLLAICDVVLKQNKSS